ncbi:hypothetical protein Pmar_PMAR029574 [Perkinsus marinus ATCC 50983]|uniref:Uncharacterized protein n=1 Tax=Perkinsus marinus (strain ATCC 50983 / TXsc) TaxID=423536 RepID=C5LD52_PERM5|nr:hypothetical protein Pmar_PMAR029574 [Perkinsus marinus ATCC 50983]EER05396.1 hypothetical protein Pmar_PMAR029574 [Perkinsus marinus ATCC 50983]|eukprot:XP_002773580.1 hypothetical protein Pmar_PMAR029574 [Perkinsus marinus ATCC 50983]
MGKIRRHKKTPTVATSAPYEGRSPLVEQTEMEIESQVPQSGDDVVSHLLDRKTSDVTVIGLANFLSTPTKRGHHLLASTNLLVLMLPRLGVDESRSQPAAVRQAVLSVYTSAVSWAQEKLLRNLIKEHGLINTVMTTLREDMRMLSDSTMAPVKNKKKSSQRQVEHDARIEIIEAEWELLGGLVRLCAPPHQPVLPPDVIDLALQTAMAKDCDAAVRVAASSMLSRVATEEMCSDCCLAPMTHRIADIERTIQDAEDPLLAAELTSALCRGYHMELFAPETGGEERAERVVEEIHRLVSSTGCHLVDSFTHVVDTVASIQPAPVKGAAADSSPSPAEPAKQRGAQSVLDAWRRNARPPFMFTGRAEAYSSVLKAAMGCLAELCDSLTKALDEALVARVRSEMPVEMFSDLASLWSLHANALESCGEIIIVENAVDEAGVSCLAQHCSSSLDSAMPLFSKLDWGRERAYGSAIGELLQALYQALLFASMRGCCSSSTGEDSMELVRRSVHMTALMPPLSEDMVQAQVACITWLARCHGHVVDVCEGLLELVRVHAGEKGAFSRRILVAAFEAIFEVFGADDNPVADQVLRGRSDPGWQELLEAGVRRLKREAKNCDEEDVEGAAINGEAFIEYKRGELCRS